MSYDINSQQVDIENLFKQNVNDLTSIKELYRKLKELEKKISQIKYINSNLADKLKKDYEKLKRIILDENIQLQLDNKINEVNLQLDNKINEVNLQLDTKANKNEIFTMANMGQDVKEAMTGGSVAVVGKNSVLTDNIVDGQVTENKTSFLKKSRNLLDEKKLKVNTYINPLNGTEVSMTTYVSSDYIEITPNTDYIFSNNDLSQVRSVAYYDENKNYVVGSEKTSTIKTTNENVKYIRISITSNAKNNQLEKGTVATAYEIYGTNMIKANVSVNNIIGKIPLEKINVDDILKLSRSRLYGKKIAFLGDSISDETSSLASQIEKYYYRYIQENTDCEIYMHGCAGTGFNYRHEGKQDSINDRVKDIPNDADYIVVFAGTNDWGNNNGTILGDMEDYLNNRNNPYSSLYSAIGNTIEKLVSKFPFGKIAFITPLPRWDKGADMLHGANSRGFTLRQVAKAIIEICEWWSIPVLDLNAKSNICSNGTLATGPVYYLDGLHPNTKGNKEILAPKIQTFLETL